MAVVITIESSISCAGYSMSEDPADPNKSLITPATTPGSINDDERSLVPSHPPSPTKTPWYAQYPPPYALMTVSLIQLLVFSVETKTLHKLLRFDPYTQDEVWRFVTYMFLHDSFFHVILNVVIQCLFAFNLEKKQGSLRVGILYFAAGATGALGASCLRPDLIVGASAGVYALLISHLSHIILNFYSTKYKIWSCLTILIIVISDVIFNLVHTQSNSEPVISEGAHIGGAVSGLLLGLLFYKSKDKDAEGRNTIAFWTAFAVYSVLIITFLLINFQIRKCTPIDYLRVRFTYIC